MKPLINNMNFMNFSVLMFHYFFSFHLSICSQLCECVRVYIVVGGFGGAIVHFNMPPRVGEILQTGSDLGF